MTAPYNPYSVHKLLEDFILARLEPMLVKSIAGPFGPTLVNGRDPAYSGTLQDLTVTGTYTGEDQADYEILVIDGDSDPNVYNIDRDGVRIESLVQMDTSDHPIPDSQIMIKWGAVMGHTNGQIFLIQSGCLREVAAYPYRLDSPQDAEALLQSWMGRAPAGFLSISDGQEFDDLDKPEEVYAQRRTVFVNFATLFAEQTRDRRRTLDFVAFDQFQERINRALIPESDWPVGFGFYPVKYLGWTRFADENAIITLHRMSVEVWSSCRGRI